MSGNAIAHPDLRGLKALANAKKSQAQNLATHQQPNELTTTAKASTDSKAVQSLSPEKPNAKFSGLSDSEAPLER